MKEMIEKGKVLVAILTLITISLSVIISCGGTFFATGDMTLTVNPSSVSISYNGTVSTGVQRFSVVILNSEGKAVPGVTVTSYLDSFFVSSGITTFPDCPSKTSCSCVTNSVGECKINVSYKMGTGYNYTHDIMFQSGPLVQMVTFSVSDQ
jgi:hypothetical protein